MSSTGLSGAQNTDLNDPLNLPDQPEHASIGGIAESAVTQPTQSGHHTPSADPTRVGPEPGAASALDPSNPDDQLLDIVEVVTLDATPAPDLEALLASNPPTFRWWYIPAVALPIAAGGATVALLLARRNRQRLATPTLNGAYASLAKQSRSLLDAARANALTQQATNAMQSGLTSARAVANKLPDQTSALRDASTKAIQTTRSAAPVLLGRANNVVSDRWNTTASQLNDLLNQVNAQITATAPKAIDTTQRNANQVAKRVTNLTRSSQPTQTAKKANDATQSWFATALASASALTDIVNTRQPTLRANAQQTAQRAQAQAAAARQKAIALTQAAKARATAQAAQAQARADKATRRTRSSLKGAQRTVRGTWRRAQVFTLSMLTASMSTYILMWRRRLMERELRETAGGRLVRDA